MKRHTFNLLLTFLLLNFSLLSASEDLSLKIVDRLKHYENSYDSVQLLADLHVKHSFKCF